jgi:Flp pilus assembly protein protease CpaA
MTTATPESESNVLAASRPDGADVATLGDSRGTVLAVAAAPIAAVTWLVTGAAAAVPVTLVGAVALVAAVSDLRTNRIPNRLILTALGVLAGSWVLVSIVDDRPMAPLLIDLAAGLALSGAPAMFVIWLVAPRVLGGGDWKLLSVLGITVGYLAPLGATVIVMAAFVGGLAVAAVVRQRNIILGPPLALGYAAAVAAVTFAPDLFGNWYR